MNGTARAEIESLLSAFAWYADRGCGAEMAALFLPDGVLHVGTLELKDHNAIAEDCYRRAKDAQRKTRHVWTNFRIESEDATRIRSTAIQLTFEMSGAGSQTQLRLNDLIDEFRRDEQGNWRLLSRRIERQAALVL